ncbi:hypothetical protein AAFN85_16300 [Mucilaginibacter sp. CAU 1740]|uniref:hypothetical protein n=1 Tax=Mucilaginibacter sp. CAU 1740 TaxID=3140365 RepID=UPI00325C0062
MVHCTTTKVNDGTNGNTGGGTTVPGGACSSGGVSTPANACITGSANPSSAPKI